MYFLRHCVFFSDNFHHNRSAENKERNKPQKGKFYLDNTEYDQEKTRIDRMSDDLKGTFIDKEISRRKCMMVSMLFVDFDCDKRPDNEQNTEKLNKNIEYRWGKYWSA